MTLPIAVFKTVFSRRGLVSFGVFALLAGFIVSFAWAKQTGLLSASTQQAAPYSELYFAQPGTIPVQLAAGTSTSIPFTVTNHEGVATTYRYQVTVSDGAHTTTTTTGQTMLLDGAQTTLPAYYTLPSKPGSYTILIELMGQKQVIQMHIKGV